MNIFKRIAEPSTHAALASLSSVGPSIATHAGASAHAISTFGAVASVAFALLAVFLPERAA